METFNELKNDVYEIAQAKLGELTEEIKERLDFELGAIERYGRTELICTLGWLFNELSNKDIYV